MSHESREKGAGKAPLRVLFYEPTHTGHHFPYLARMLPGFLRLPIHPILATTPGGLASHEFATTLAPLASGLELLPCCELRSYRSSYQDGWQRYAELKRTIRQVQPDHVCILYAHGIWQLWAASMMYGGRLAPRGTTIEMWEYRGGFTYPDAQSIGDRMKRRLLRRLLNSGQLAVLHADDEMLLSFARKACPNTERSVLTPNPIKFRDMIQKGPARQALGLSVDGRLASCSGMIDRRKGCDLAIKAFAMHADSTGEQNAGDRLLLAGPHDAEIRQLLDQPAYKSLVESGRIVSLDRFVNEDEMFYTAAASDLVLAPYPNQSGRSSIILWAAAAGRPVLGVARGCIEYVIKQEGLGETCDVKDIGVLTARWPPAWIAPGPTRTWPG